MKLTRSYFHVKAFFLIYFCFQKIQNNEEKIELYYKSEEKIESNHKLNDQISDITTKLSKLRMDNIDVDNNTLSISSEIKEEHEEKDESYTRREFGYSSFKRTFTLPDTVESDKIKAKYSEGILSVHLPKREEAKQKPAKRISVS